MLRDGSAALSLMACLTLALMPVGGQLWQTGCQCMPAGPMQHQITGHRVSLCIPTRRQLGRFVDLACRNQRLRKNAPMIYWQKS